MLNLTDKAKDQLYRDMFLINSDNARMLLAREIMSKLNQRRKEERYALEKEND